MRPLVVFMGIVLVLSAGGCGGGSSGESGARQEKVAAAPAGFSDEVQAVLQKRAALLDALAADPVVLAAVKASNAEHKDTPMSAILDSDRTWQATAGLSDLISSFMTNACAQRLIDFEERHDGFPEIFVTNKRGLIVGESNKTSDYYQADEAWWVEAYNNGAGKSYHGEIEFDESAGSESIALYVPVKDPATGSAIGVIKAVCDITVIKMEL